MKQYEVLKYQEKDKKEVPPVDLRQQACSCCFGIALYKKTAHHTNLANNELIMVNLWNANIPLNVSWLQIEM